MSIAQTVPDACKHSKIYLALFKVLHGNIVINGSKTHE